MTSWFIFNDTISSLFSFRDVCWGRKSIAWHVSFYAKDPLACKKFIPVKVRGEYKIPAAIFILLALHIPLIKHVSWVYLKVRVFLIRSIGMQILDKNCKKGKI